MDPELRFTPWQPELTREDKLVAADWLEEQGHLEAARQLRGGPPASRKQLQKALNAKGFSDFPAFREVEWFLELAEFTWKMICRKCLALEDKLY